MPRRTLGWLVAAGWMCAILYTSSLGQAVTPVGGAVQTMVAKLGHMVEYSVLGALLAWAVLQEGAVGSRSRRAVLVAIVLGLVFASFDELRQSFSPGREPRVTDVLLDVVSVTIGAAGLVKLFLEQPAPEP